MIKFFRLLLTNKNADAAIMAKVISRTGKFVTIKATTNKIPANNPKIKNPTLNPSLYNTIIKAIKTIAKPVSFCNLIIRINGKTIKSKAKTVFL